MPALMILMYLTPILYPLKLVPESMRPWVAANPFSWLVGRLRDALLDGRLALEWGDADCRRGRHRACSSAAAGCSGGCRRTSRTSYDARQRAAARARRTSARTTRRSRRAAASLRLVWDLLRGAGAAHVFRALDDVSFVLQPGASLGVIGENGAGKSTLLKIVAGVIAADARQRRSERPRRRAARARLGLPSRLHGARQHRPRGGAARPRSRRRSHAKRDEIVAFADIGEHIHDPIKHYSSGMVVRLGFAVATALRPHILITDEVLAVGDESFQKKCIAWMEELPRRRRHAAPVLAQHVPHPEALPRTRCGCTTGKTERYGPAMDVTQAYLAYHEEKSARRAQADRRRPRRARGRRVRGAVARHGPRRRRVARAGRSRIRGEVFSPDGRAPSVLVGIVRADGTPVYGVATDMDRRDAAQARARPLRVLAHAARPRAAARQVHACARTRSTPRACACSITSSVRSSSTGDVARAGLVRLAHRWNDDG